MKICLSMIVKNESERIERALASVAPFIDSWVIVDTGSTDSTKQKIVDFFQARSIPGEIRDADFVTWSQARNAALGWARTLSVFYLPDYFLLCDADMELVVSDPNKFASSLTGDAIEMFQQAGGVHYTNVRLVKSSCTGLYRGATHEYFDVTATVTVPENVAYFKDHADGANRPEKFKRDIRLLKNDLKQDPDNERSFFYLAQSYRDAGKPAEAIKWFRRRVDAGGWAEEQWQAQLSMAHCYKTLGDEAKFTHEALKAHAMRPTRPEAMFDIAHHYRHKKDMQPVALAMAEAVEHLPKSDDKLFVNDYVATAGVKEEISITAFYVPGKKDKGYKVSSELGMLAGPYAGAREQARNNLFFYIQPLAEFCPSFKWASIPFEAEPGWTPMNPSVTLHNNSLMCNIRTVNYRMDEEGRYLIRGTDGEANSTNPINTRNFIVALNADPFGKPMTHMELRPPADLPVAYPYVIGFEDVRLFSGGPGALYGSACLRQAHPDGNCEQAMFRISPRAENGNTYAQVVELKRMLREPRETQKNWAPIVDYYAARVRPMQFMYRPLELVDSDGKTVQKTDPGLDVGQVSGSPQVIPFGQGWLTITHEARYLPGSHLRYYWHRFACYNKQFTTVHFSRPFYFNDKVIEFCAGMCSHPTKNELVISYGYRDADARIATVSCDEVEKFLWRDGLRG